MNNTFPRFFPELVRQAFPPARERELIAVSLMQSPILGPAFFFSHSLTSSFFFFFFALWQ